MTYKDYLATKIGQPVALMCTRYQYHGIVETVEDNFLVLNPVRSILFSGEATREKPQRVEMIHGSVTIPLSSIEMNWEPKWLNDPIEEEKNK